MVSILQIWWWGGLYLQDWYPCAHTIPVPCLRSADRLFRLAGFGNEQRHWPQIGDPETWDEPRSPLVPLSDWGKPCRYAEIGSLISFLRVATCCGMERSNDTSLDSHMSFPHCGRKIGKLWLCDLPYRSIRKSIHSMCLMFRYAMRPILYCYLVVFLIVSRMQSLKTLMQIERFTLRHW